MDDRVLARAVDEQVEREAHRREPRTTRRARTNMCPHCGRRPTEHGCRGGAARLVVPVDRATPEPGVDPRVRCRPPDTADSDPEAKTARKAERADEREFDEADAVWIALVAEHRAVELRAQRSPMMFAADLSPITPERDPAERELRDAEHAARSERERVGRRLAAARQAEAAARRRAAE